MAGTSVAPQGDPLPKSQGGPSVLALQQVALNAKMGQLFKAAADLDDAQAYYAAISDLRVQADAAKDAVDDLYELRHATGDDVAKLKSQIAVNLQWLKTAKEAMKDADYDYASGKMSLADHNAYQANVDKAQSAYDNSAAQLNDLGVYQINADAQLETLKIMLVDLGHAGEDPRAVANEAASALKSAKDAYDKAVVSLGDDAVAFAGPSAVQAFMAADGFSAALFDIPADQIPMLGSARIVGALSAGAMLSAKYAEMAAAAVAQAANIQQMAMDAYAEMTALAGPNAKLPTDYTMADAQLSNTRYKIIMLGKQGVDLDLATNRSTARAMDFANKSQQTIEQVLAFSAKHPGALTQKAQSAMQEAVDTLAQAKFNADAISAQVVKNGAIMKQNLAQSGIAHQAVQDKNAWGVSTVDNSFGTTLTPEEVLEIDPAAANANGEDPPPPPSKKKESSAGWLLAAAAVAAVALVRR